MRKSQGGVKCAGFASKEEAIDYAGCKPSKIRFFEVPIKPPTFCFICEKPFHGRSTICPTCRRKKNKLPINVTLWTLASAKKRCGKDDVFQFISDKPWIVYQIARNIPRKERAELYKSRKEELRSDTYLNTEFSKQDGSCPEYIQELFKQDPIKEFLYLEEKKTNPKVHYLCKRCNQEQCQNYAQLKRGLGHDCSAAKPSGEVIVEEYLKAIGVVFNTQRSTLPCINPKTKRVMPYDFELPEQKLIIEVQGAQHDSFVPYFHGSVENFEYQQWRDLYKKSYAEQQGYNVCYLNYQEIESGSYRSILDQYLNPVRTL